MLRQITQIRYYALDDNVAREMLGKKLSSRYRKDLDEVADRTGVRLKSCRYLVVGYVNRHHTPNSLIIIISQTAI